MSKDELEMDINNPIDDQALGRLLVYIEQERDRRCRDIIRDAGAEAESIIGDARRRARDVVHHSVVSEKLHRDRENRRMQAEVSMRLRRTWFRLIRRELDQAWPLLRQGIVDHWRASEENRHTWLAGTLEVATKALGPGLWYIEHPEDWHMLEGAPQFRALKDEHEALQIHCEPRDHDAGFVIRCGDVSVSTTLDGLLSRPSQIEGLWLAILLEEGVLELRQ